MYMYMLACRGDPFLQLDLCIHTERDINPIKDKYSTENSSVNQTALSCLDTSIY